MVLRMPPDARGWPCRVSAEGVADLLAALRADRMSLQLISRKRSLRMGWRYRLAGIEYDAAKVGVAKMIDETTFSVDRKCASLNVLVTVAVRVLGITGSWATASRV